MKRWALAPRGCGALLRDHMYKLEGQLTEEQEDHFTSITDLFGDLLSTLPRRSKCRLMPKPGSMPESQHVNGQDPLPVLRMRTTYLLLATSKQEVKMRSVVVRA